MGAEPSVMPAGLATDGVEENPRLAFPLRPAERI